MPRPILVVSTLPVLLAAVPAAAQEGPYEPPGFITEPATLPDGWEERGVWRLDLSEALRVAVDRNLGIVLQRELSREASLRARVARGPFEPVLRATYSHSDVDVVPSTSQEGGAGDILTFIDDRWTMAVGKRFQTGTEVDVGFESNRSRSSLGTAVQPLNYRSNLFVSVTQPLLRGFSLDRVVPRAPVLRAELASERAREQLAVEMMEVVQRTESAYWDVVHALKSYRVQLAAHDRAVDQLELTQRQINAGVLAPSEIIGSQSILAQRRLDLVEAESVIERAWDQLRAELNLPRSEWRLAILPQDAPVFEPALTSPEAALEVAIENRPELRQQDLDIEQATLAAREADNARLPRVDLGLRYHTVGQDAAYGGSLGQVVGRDAPGWTVLFTLTWTPLDRAAAAAAEIQESQVRVARARKDQRILDLYRSVREAVRNLESSARQVRAAASFRALAEQSLEVEQRKFLAGTSFNFVVAERQESVARAQLAELTALLAHQKAKLALERATGLLLRSRRIELEVR
jgi:outer membrane protein TolC